MAKIGCLIGTIRFQLISQLKMIVKVLHASSTACVYHMVLERQNKYRLYIS